MYSIANIILNDDPLMIVDIGASLVGGDAPRYSGLIEDGKARLIAFEPDQSALHVLREKYPFPHICLPLFIGDGKPGIYFETNWAPTGSLFEPNTPLLEKFDYLAEITTVVNKWPVDTVRLDDVSEIDDVDFLKIDAQGAELMVFENAPRVLSGVSLIHTEVSFVEMYKGAPLFGDIDRQLRSLGFQWHALTGFGTRPFHPMKFEKEPQHEFIQQLWGDVVYVRNWMTFDLFPATKLIKLAVLLHDLYSSYDLAHVAMAAADRQLGTDYAENYAKWLAE